MVAMVTMVVVMTMVSAVAMVVIVIIVVMIATTMVAPVAVFGIAMLTGSRAPLVPMFNSRGVVPAVGKAGGCSGNMCCHRNQS